MEREKGSKKIESNNAGNKKREWPKEEGEGKDGPTKKEDKYQKSEQVGEVSDHEVGATVAFKGNVPKRKQTEEMDAPSVDKAAFRAKVFAQHGGSTLTDSALKSKDKKEGSPTRSEAAGESSTKRTRPDKKGEDKCRRRSIYGSRIRH